MFLKTNSFCIDFYIGLYIYIFFSVWTIDLANLSQLFGIPHELCTITLGVDQNFSKQVLIYIIINTIFYFILLLFGCACYCLNGDAGPFL